MLTFLVSFTFGTVWILLMYLAVRIGTELERMNEVGQVWVTEVPETPEETWMRAYQEHCALHNMPNEMAQELQESDSETVEQVLQEPKGSAPLEHLLHSAK